MADGNITVGVSTQAAQAELERLRAELAEAVTALPQAIRNERERCASACEDEARLWEADGNGPAAEARLCAARIRSLA